MNPDDDLEREFESLLAPMAPEQREAFLEVMRQSRAAQALPRLRRVDEAALRALEGEALDQALVGYVYDRMGGELGPAVGLEALPRGLQVVFLTFIVEAEVMNGGFNQFFWNSSGQHADLVPGALREIGADEAARLFERAQAAAALEDGMRERLQAERTLEAFSQSYDESALDVFDKPFWKLAEGFAALREAYVRRHVALVVDAPVLH